MVDKAAHKVLVHSKEHLRKFAEAAERSEVTLNADLPVGDMDLKEVNWRQNFCHLHRWKPGVLGLWRLVDFRLKTADGDRLASGLSLHVQHRRRNVISTGSIKG